MLTTVLHAQCCICLQFKMKYIKCKKCKNAVVCRDCLPSLCEGGLCNKCPVCRQTEWKKKVKKNKIMPESKVNIIINPRYMEEDKESWCDLCTPLMCGLCCLKGFRICNLIFLIYCAGLLTVFCFVGDSLELSFYYWLPAIIGLVEFLLLLACCFGCCGIKMGLKEILDFSIQKI